MTKPRPRPTAPTIRCAIYTRKSTDEGLDLDFNSLDAQRESGEAYIKSQTQEGWVCLPDRYDDGGFTGGNIDRPALKRLLADIDLAPLAGAEPTDSLSLLSGRLPKLVLLDRDDTLIRVPAGRRYLYGEDPIEFLPGAVDFLRRCNAASIPVTLVTNQQGVSLPEFPDMTLASVERFHERLHAALAEQEARLDRVYVCSHAEAENCDCRKPKPGLILKALRDFGVSPPDALLIGDSERDVAAASAAGVRGIRLPAEDAERCFTSVAEAFFSGSVAPPAL